MLAACGRVSKFNGVHSLDLHFPDNFGADATQINFIGLKGEFTEVAPSKLLTGLVQAVCDGSSAAGSKARSAPLAVSHMALARLCNLLLYTC